MTPAGTRLKFRLDQRLLWFQNEWLFKWHHIDGRRVVEIDTFDGRKATYAGIRFEGSCRTIFWNAITRGVRKEVIEQFAWVQEQIRGYVRAQAEAAIDESAQLLTGFAQAVRNAAVEKDRILRGNGTQFPPQHDAGRWTDVSPAEITLQATALKAALFPPEPIVTTQGTPHGRRYQVALSFAGEQREYVGAVALAPKACGVVVFYDEFEAVTL